MSLYYPISLNIEGRKCVVVGGGIVAMRKVKVLLEHGAKVDVISPDICPEMKQLVDDGSVNLKQRGYKRGDLEGAIISVAATDDNKTNVEVSEESRKKGIIINVVDDLQLSDFIIPSYLRRGDVTIAVSTGGKSPALARKIRSTLEEEFGNEYASLAILVNNVRSKLKQKGIIVDSDSWQEVLVLEPLIDMLREGRNQEAEDVLFNNLEKTSRKTSRIKKKVVSK